MFLFIIHIIIPSVVFSTEPINESNNLGKSINYHGFTKMKGAFQYMRKELNKAFQYMRKELNKIKQIKEINDPFSYMNSLLKLFNTSLSMNFIGGHNILNVDKNEVYKFNKLFNYNMYNNIYKEKK